MSFLEVRHVSKLFPTKGGVFQALKDVSFCVEKGEIFGVIGLSGAGKSTLVRCINLLEKPTEGDVLLEGKNLLALSKAELRAERQSIGMIFQQFHLLMQRTALDNVCLPLEIAGLSKKAAREEAITHLESVGLSDKAHAYPAQLSGGQKQRVAIARVLASHPRLLLCDEATSALDPQTTGSILDLLQEINSKRQITMLVITHEMRVVEKLCHRVAVLEEGQIVETGPVTEVFRNPQREETKRLLLVRESQEIMKDIGKEDGYGR